MLHTTNSSCTSIFLLWLIIHSNRVLRAPLGVSAMPSTSPPFSLFYYSYATSSVSWAQPKVVRHLKSWTSLGTYMAPPSSQIGKFGLWHKCARSASAIICLPPFSGSLSTFVTCPSRSEFPFLRGVESYGHCTCRCSTQSKFLVEKQAWGNTHSFSAGGKQDKNGIQLSEFSVPKFDCLLVFMYLLQSTHCSYLSYSTVPGCSLAFFFREYCALVI